MAKFILAFTLLLVGCGTTTGGGGIAVSGGNTAGTPCNVAVKEGCLLVLGGSERMSCVAGKWAVLEVCALGTACTEQLTAGEAAHTTACAAAGDTTSSADASSDAEDASVGSDTANIDEKKDGMVNDTADSATGGGSDVEVTDAFVGTDTYTGDDGYPYNDGFISNDGYVGYDTNPYGDAYSYDTNPYDIDYDGYYYDTNPYDVDYDGYSYDVDYDSYGSDTSSDPCVYDKPTTFPGCTSYDDAAYVNTLTPGTTAFNNFVNIVQECTTVIGCLNEGTQCLMPEGAQVAQGKCVADCIAQQTGYAISTGCAWCYGEFSGICGYTYCFTPCTPDATSPDCQNCLAMNCDAKREACKAGM